jgi:uncharacterized protein (DUF433 family)
MLISMSFDKERHMGQLHRITQQPEVMGGKACIRGMRVTVGMVVGQVGAGHTIDEILADYPYLERELTVERTRAGLEVARQLGRGGGRKP